MQRQVHFIAGMQAYASGANGVFQGALFNHRSRQQN
jgi:hypothetical protein